MKIAKIIIGLLIAAVLTAARGADTTTSPKASKSQAGSTDKWEREVVIERHFGPGDIWLSIPGGKSAVFRLNRADTLPEGGTSKLPRYEVSYQDTNMNEVWRGVWLIAVGSVTPPAVADLRPWDHNDQTIVDEYNEKLGLLHHDLLARECSWTRLEGFMPVLYKDQPRVDRVRMVLLNNAVTHPDGTKTDLVLISLAFADGPDTKENGGASGPPH